jgi:hypothetical protein
MADKVIIYDGNGDVLKRVSTQHTPWFAFLLAIASSVVAALVGYQAHSPKSEAVIETPTVVWATRGTEISGIVISNKVAEDDPPEIPAPVGHPPLRIVVGSDVYSVHYTTAQFLLSHNCGGYTRTEAHEIWLGRDVDTPLEIRHVVLHELMHAAIAATHHGGYAVRWEPPLTDDGFIEATSPALLGILRDNPRLVHWLESE